MSDEDDSIPLLDDVVRPGNGQPARPRQETERALSEAEIEAIAARVVERHAKTMEAAVARAIRAALDNRARSPDQSGGGADDDAT